MDVARRGVRLARAAAAGSEVAVAFSINGDVDTPDGQETIRLLARAFEADPPDLILLETLSLVRPSTYQTIEALLETGLPLWLSFRRCRHGVCGVYGEHWGGPEGDAFGRAARRFEELGAAALLINCIPPDHATGMLSWLRDFTDLPLGVYPNLGYLSSAGWRHERPVHADDFAELALAWREEGAQIVGGCCGVGPEHIAAARSALEGTRPGHRRIASTGVPGPAEALAPPRCPASLERPLRTRALPAAVPRDRRRGRRRRPQPGEPAGLEASLARAHRPRHALPRHRLRLGDPVGPARAQRRRLGARAGHRPGRGPQHADQRVSQRRRRARAGDRGRPLPVGPRRALRRRRRDV